VLGQVQVEAEVQVQLQKMLYSLLLWTELGWSMVLNPKLIMQPKDAQLALGLCKKKGSPTAQCIACSRLNKRTHSLLSTRQKQLVCECAVLISFYGLCSDMLLSNLSCG
jgi:hypothetical protein